MLYTVVRTYNSSLNYFKTIVKNLIVINTYDKLKHAKHNGYSFSINKY